ncbi:hypothetical protein [Streptomyces sp. NRRL S-646]|uniref:hypothetical protein n=1 Tax=Streptomyces sp. NRRL S-646 TaxID=1463917 RepID=UPI0004C828DA|nr:hypothetical protein [Streptomyces sp. NRRL S-646]
MTAATGQPAPAGPRITRAPRNATEQAVTNARMTALLSRPDPGPAATHLALVHFTGRRSKQPYTVPAGVHRLDSALYLATSSSWRHNFTDTADAELTWQGRRTPARLRLVTDAHLTARGYLELWQRYGPEAGPRRLGIAVTDGPEPTLDDFGAAVADVPLTLVAVTLETGNSAELAVNERTSR